jgi:hypothetical protein
MSTTVTINGAPVASQSELGRLQPYELRHLSLPFDQVAYTCYPCYIDLRRRVCADISRLALPYAFGAPKCDDDDGDVRGVVLRGSGYVVFARIMVGSSVD